MNLLFKLLVIIVSIASSQKIFSQNLEIKEAQIVHTYKMYDYEFSGETTTAQLDLLKAETEKLQFVTKSKIFYKPEKGRGMIRLFTDEYMIDGDNKDIDFEFNIYNLKMLITKFNLTPVEYRFETITDNNK